MANVKVTLKDGSVKEVAAGTTLLEVAKGLSQKLGKQALLAVVDGVNKDLTDKLEHALCHPHHTGAHGQGLGGDFPFRHYHQQFADGAVPAVQIFAPERAGTAGHKVFRCVGGDICQEDDGF